MSAFASVVARLGELSESELRQLYLVVGVRLGIQDGASSAGAMRQPGGKSSGKKAAGNASGTSRAGNARASKGNPSRKSQWETHPLYKEYRRLKKAVETQSKEAKTSFNDVDTAESRAYKAALSQWLEAKSSFRGRNTAQETSGETPEQEAGPSGSAQPRVSPPQLGVQPTDWAEDAQAVADAAGNAGDENDSESDDSDVEMEPPQGEPSASAQRGGKGKAPAGRGKAARGRGR